MHARRSLIAFLVVACAAVCADASIPALPTGRALLTTGASNALSVVPGSGGVILSSVTQARLRTSRTGAWWALTAFATGQPQPNDTVILVGDADGIAYGVVETIELAGTGVGFTGVPNAQLGVNDAGGLAFKSTTTAPAATNDAILARPSAAAAWTIVAREGDPVPGLPGESFGPFLDSVTLFDDGAVAYRAGSTSGPLPSVADDALLLSAPPSILLQSGSIVPANQLNGARAPIVGINDEAFVADDRSSWIADAELGQPGPSRAIVVRSGGGPPTAVVQRGAPILGLDGELPYASGSPVDFQLMGPGGHWAVWGTGSGGTAYAIVDGVLALREGDAIPGGDGGEALVSVVHMALNRLGHVAYAATTTLGRTVIVVDRRDGAPSLAARTFPSTTQITSATQVDFDGDGTLDDAYLGFLFDANLGLADDGSVLLLGRFTSSATLLNLGDALVIVATAARCDPDLDVDGVVGPVDLATLLGQWNGTGSADLDGDGAVGPADLALLLGAWGPCAP